MIADVGVPAIVVLIVLILAGLCFLKYLLR